MLVHEKAHCPLSQGDTVPQAAACQYPFNKVETFFGFTNFYNQLSEREIYV
jgi:hypothetical protein